MDIATYDLLSDDLKILGLKVVDIRSDQMKQRSFRILFYVWKIFIDIRD